MLDSLVGSTRASYTGWLGNRCSVLGVSHMLGVSHTHGAMPALHAWTCSSCCSNVTKQEHARGAFSVTGHVYNRVLLNVAHCNRQPCVILLSELQDQHCCESETHRQKAAPYRHAFAPAARQQFCLDMCVPLHIHGKGGSRAHVGAQHADVKFTSGKNLPCSTVQVHGAVMQCCHSTLQICNKSQPLLCQQP